MPVLPNPRYERFAQELANGKSAEDAHELAGYKRNRCNAFILKQRNDIKERLTELLTERDKMHVIATEKAIERLALDREGVISRLIAQYEKANAMDSPSAVGPAIKALELLGREIGMFIERHEMGAVGEFARMSDDELRALAGCVIEHSTPENRPTELLFIGKECPPEGGKPN